MKNENDIKKLLSHPLLQGYKMSVYVKLHLFIFSFYCPFGSIAMLAKAMKWKFPFYFVALYIAYMPRRYNIAKYYYLKIIIKKIENLSAETKK